MGRAWPMALEAQALTLDTASRSSETGSFRARVSFSRKQGLALPCKVSGSWRHTMHTLRNGNLLEPMSPSLLPFVSHNMRNSELNVIKAVRAVCFLNICLLFPAARNPSNKGGFSCCSKRPLTRSPAAWWGHTKNTGRVTIWVSARAEC